MRRKPEAVNPGPDPDPLDFLPLPALPCAILIALAEEPRHGWAIIRRLETLNHGREVPSTGSLYLALARLEERGLIEVAADAGPGERRRVFRLTTLGRRVIRLETARLAALVAVARRSLGPAGDLG